MTFPNGSRALLAVALGAVLSARLHPHRRASGLSRRRAARHRDPARRRQSRFGDRHARPADLRRPVRPARLVLCLARHPPARLQHAAARRRRPCSTSASTPTAMSRASTAPASSWSPTSTRATTRRRPWAATAACSRSCSAISARSASRAAARRRPTRDNPDADSDAGRRLLRRRRPAASTASVTRSDAVARHRRDLDLLLHADQHRPDHRVAAELAQQLGRDVGGLQARHDQHVGRARSAA